MRSENQVSLQDSLLAVRDAISFAWADTRKQVKGAGYDDRIVQTAFGQFLVHNVMNRIYQLNMGCENMKVELRPNSNNTAHHVVIRFNNMLLTVSAVAQPHMRPRAALFREEYASRQGFFRISEQNSFVPTSPRSLSEPRTSYLQILHGPKDDDRQHLGFMLIASLNHFNEYEGKPAPLDDLLLSSPIEPEHVEDIQDSINIEIRVDEQIQST